jgi:hypothetical protein
MWECTSAEYDPGFYLALRGHQPNTLIECYGCATYFPGNTGHAAKLNNYQGEPIVSAFCSGECFIRSLPSEQCARA